jgi:hypothetical protein
MRDRVDIDHVHSRAICREIGERLQACLKPEDGLAAHLRKQVDQLHESDGQSPSIVPDVVVATKGLIIDLREFGWWGRWPLP